MDCRQVYSYSANFTGRRALCQGKMEIVESRAFKFRKCLIIIADTSTLSEIYLLV